MKQLILLAALLAGPSLLGQNIETFNGDGRIGVLNATLRNSKHHISSNLKTLGTPYIDENFKECSIFFNDKKIGDFKFRHNGVIDEIEIIEKDKVEAISSLMIDKNIVLKTPEEGHIILTTYYNENQELRNGYFYTTKQNYFVRNKMKFTEGTPPINSMVRATPNRFNLFKTFYFKGADGHLVEIDRSSKKFLSLFNKSYQTTLKAYFKEHNIRLYDESDLKKLFTFIELSNLK